MAPPPSLFPPNFLLLVLPSTNPLPWFQRHLSHSQQHHQPGNQVKFIGGNSGQITSSTLHREHSKLVHIYPQHQRTRRRQFSSISPVFKQRILASNWVTFSHEVLLNKTVKFTEFWAVPIRVDSATSHPSVLRIWHSNLAEALHWCMSRVHLSMDCAFVKPILTQ